jgi:PAS domain S-box-containing protein
MSSNDPSRKRDRISSPRPEASSPSIPWTAGTALGPGSDLYRLLVENVRDYAIFALDVGGHVLTWNAGAHHLKGYEADEIIGRHFSIFYESEAIEAAFPQFELETAAREGRFEDEGWRLKKDGSRFWANVIITAIRDAQGTLVGYAKITRDLTERKLAEERAVADARRVATAEASNRAKSEFLAAMSHELRTPLNAIGGYAELIAMGLRGPITPEQAGDLDRIRRSQQHLLAVINDLLNYSRIEAGQISLDIAPVPVHEMLDSSVAMMAPQAELQGLLLELERCPPNVWLRADRTKVEQILLNLLSNAIKFTPAGGRVSVICEPDGDIVRIAITDTGVGIDEDQQEAIFEPFVQVGRSLSNPGEGTGLGLAISRDLARAMGGTLKVRSTREVGSTFTLALPADGTAASTRGVSQAYGAEHG